MKLSLKFAVENIAVVLIAEFESKETKYKFLIMYIWKEIRQ